MCYTICIAFAGLAYRSLTALLFVDVPIEKNILNKNQMTHQQLALTTGQIIESADISKFS